MKHLLWSEKHHHEVIFNNNEEYLSFQDDVIDYHHISTKKVMKRLIKDKNYTNDDIERIFGTKLIVSTSSS